MDRFYFAYGSNMALWVMSEICAEHRLMGAARLTDYRLAFTRYSHGWKGGVSDIVYAPGEVVWGGLFMIGNTCHDALDMNTHYGVGYTSTGIDVVLANSEPYHAITYTVIDKCVQEYTPSRFYMDTIMEGARELNLPRDYIKRLRAIKTNNSR
ncbi:MAG: gamma-glutamylcyclotransferase family protein [bacterium]|nr:gamma-glutamylcyclotransferase family protein [bacterium]